MSIPQFDRPLRVIQWTTGNIGRRSAHAILTRPDLELVGVYAHGAPKVGKDAAELCGWPEPTGITATDDIEKLLALDADALRFDPKQSAFGAISNMTPGSRFIEALAATPIVPGVSAHSIIPVTGDLPPDGQGDGVVKFESAHIDGVDSELVVPRQGHSAQSNPLAIEEVRRILFDHAEAVCAADGVACAQAPPWTRRPIPDGTPADRPR